MDGDRLASLRPPTSLRSEVRVLGDERFASGTLEQFRDFAIFRACNGPSALVKDVEYLGCSDWKGAPVWALPQQADIDLWIESGTGYGSTDRSLGSALNVSGKGWSTGQAWRSLTGEMLERVFGCLQARLIDELGVEASIGEVAASFPDVVDVFLYGFTGEQRATAGFPFEEPRPSARMLWLPASDTDDKEILVPAQSQLLLPWQIMNREPRYTFATSCGLAIHSDRGEARARASLELLERDALNLRWLCDVSPRLVAPCQLGEGHARALDELRGGGAIVGVEALESALPGVVTTLVWLYWPDEEVGRWSAGHAADTDLGAALSSAISELFQSEIGMRAVRSGEPAWLAEGHRLISPRPDILPTQLTDTASILHYFGLPDQEAVIRSGFIARTAGEYEGSALSLEHGTLLAAAREIGLRFYFIEMEFLAEWAAGPLWMVKAVCPQLTVPSLGGLSCLRHPRLRYPVRQPPAPFP